jgi:hypothetical protein
MTYFDEHGEYWGDKTKPIIGAGNGKLTARSVKIFADGTYLRFKIRAGQYTYQHIRSTEDWIRCGKFFVFSGSSSTP